MSRARSMLARYRALDAALVAKGFPATSRWWLETVEGFYLSPRRQLVLRVGRRGGKSSTLARVAVLEALYGEHKVPPGDVGIVGIVSVSRDEASQRLRTIKAILDALRVKYRPIEGGIELTGRRLAFKVFAASVAGVVGGTWICAICDEVARWRDHDTGANPAKEVLGSLRPTLATMPSARIFLSSSPLGSEDAHATAFDLGDNDFQGVAYAPTWLANPTITEADTRALEPDARIWAREYAALPQAGLLAAFDPDDVARAFVPREIPEHTVIRGAWSMVIDASSLRGDTFAWGLVRWLVAAHPYKVERRYSPMSAIGWHYVICNDAKGKPIELPPEQRWTSKIQFAKIRGVGERKFTLSQIVDQIVRDVRTSGAVGVVGDQREEFALTAEFARHKVPFRSLPWTASNKSSAVEAVRRWLRDGDVMLPEHDTLRRELLGFEERITPSGSLTFAARGRGHDDHVALLVTAALADASGLISYAPHVPRVRRYFPPSGGHPAFEF